MCGGNDRSGPFHSESAARAFVSALAAAVVLASGTIVRAAEVSWSGPPSCDNRSYVLGQVESLSGRSLETIEGFSFEVTVKATDSTWELVLVTRTTASDTPRERRLRGKSCSEVSDAAAVAITMALGGREEPEQPDANQPAAPGESEAPSEPRPPESAPATRANASPSSKTRVEGLLALHALVDAGSVGSAALGFDAAAGVALGQLRAIVELGYLLPNEVDLDAGRGGTFELRSIAALACITKPFGSIAGSGCGGYELGSMSGEGKGVADPHLGSALWQAVRLELGLGVPLAANLRAVLNAGVAVPVARPEFVLDEGEVVHRPAAVAFRARAGLELSF
jgi:hypothetical protein